MIVRDEARLLARCLKSFQGAFDELCVVDTGSVDHTLKIAAQFGARVQSFYACNGPDGRIADFGLARNAACDMARGRWILFFDADEILVSGTERLRRHARRNASAALRVRMRQGHAEWRTLRMFQNRPAHRFHRRIHEWVEIDGLIASDPEILFEHRPEKTGKESSFERNLRLLRRDLRDVPGEPRTLFQIGQTLRSGGKTTEALRYYQRFFASGKGLPIQRVTAARAMAACELGLGRTEAAIGWALSALAIDPRYADVHCLLGDAYSRRGEHAFASLWYKTALACGSPPVEASFPVIPACYGAYPRRRLRDCERLLRRETRRNGGQH
jgi:tetratricopeptide (TPR) repeat protein